MAAPPTLLEHFASTENAQFIVSILSEPLFMGPVAFLIGARLLYSSVSRVGFVRTWLIILAFFELIPLHKILVNEDALDGFSVNLVDKPAERRLWCVFLLFLVFSRLLGAVAGKVSRAARWHVAAVHVTELVFLYGEQVVHTKLKCPREFPPWDAFPNDPPATIFNLFVEHVYHPLYCEGGGSSIVLKIVAANALFFVMWACASMGPPKKGNALPFGLKRD